MSRPISSVSRTLTSFLSRKTGNFIRVGCAVILTAGLALISPAMSVSAASVSWDGEAGDGLWSNPLNWSGDTLPEPGDYISISGTAGEVILDIDFTLEGIVTVSGSGNTLKIDSGIRLTLDSHLPPGQYNAVIIEQGASLINEGTVIGTKTSPLPRIYVTETSSVTNYGTANKTEVYLRGGSYQRPALINHGSMNTVRVSTLVGTVTNHGIISNAQLSFQFGAVNNTASGIITTTSTLSTLGSRFINSTVFDNNGTLTNNTQIENQGVFNNYGTVDNAGIFTNTCDFNAGKLGVFNNFGTVTGNPIIYEGSLWDNDSGDNLWSNPVNWSSDVLPASTNDIIINNTDGTDITVVVDTDITIDGQFGLRNSLGAPATTTLLISEGITFTNNGEITLGGDTILHNQGTIINNRDIRASGSASFIDEGTFIGNPVIGINSTWDGEAGDGLWSTPQNWVRDTVPNTGDYVIISGSGDVVLDIDFTVNGRITVSGSDTVLIIDNGVTLTLDPRLAPGQYDTIFVDSDASLINNGSIVGTQLSPLRRIYVTSTGGMVNNGTVSVTGVFMRGGPHYPALVNNGSMNTVRISTLVGTVTNNGLIDDAQLDFQSGVVNNTASGIITTTSTLSILGSRFINKTVFDNHGTLMNLTNIENKGIVNNHGHIDTSSGTFENEGTFNSYCGSTVEGTITGNPVNIFPCNEPPVVNAGPDQRIYLSENVTVHASFTDPEIMDTHTASIDWGDGYIEPVTVNQTEQTLYGTHSYAQPGLYTVIVTITDSNENEGSDTLQVTVIGVETLLDEIKNDIEELNLPKGIGSSLTKNIDNAEKLLNDSNDKNDKAAINNLKAEINKIKAQRGKKIPEAEADALIAKLKELIATLSGE